MHRSTGTVGLALATLLTLLASPVWATPAAAHDFWLEPSDATPEPGTTVRLRLRVGDESPGQPVARRSDHLARFWARGAQLDQAVVGAEGADPAGFLRISSPEAVAVGYLSAPQPHHLPADRFERYLAAEGLEAISTLRRERGESATPGRELFVRSAKTVLDARSHARADLPSESSREARSGAGYELTIGLPLELVPLADPALVPAGGTFPIRLLLHGEPISGVLVSARPLRAEVSEADSWIDGRTNAEGVVDLPIPSGGSWLVSAVTMEEAAPGSAAEVDWLSFWASLTLDVGSSVADVVADYSSP